MITITDPLTYSIDFDLSQYGKPEEILFFDIETTGLSPEYCTIYLIGCVFYSDGSWYLKQFFAENTDAESEILFHFLTMLSKYSVLIHFNGDTFDIPFVRKRASRLDILHANNSMESLDIYREIKPFKKLLGLNDCKQKTIELLLGIDREDKYNGGQLINVYRDYIISHNEEEKRLLLLHNADDLRGLPKLLPVLYYTKLFNGEGHIENISISGNPELYVGQDSQNPACNFKDASCLELTVTYSDIKIPSPVTVKNDYYAVTAKGNTVSILINIFTGELKHYYGDYKNYYYLPDEDMAIHKSVAEFVDKEHRKKATAKTCYTKKYGCFIPGFEELGLPVFYSEYPLKTAYILLDNNIFSDKDFLTGYCSALIKELK